MFAKRTSRYSLLAAIGKLQLHIAWFSLIAAVVQPMGAAGQITNGDFDGGLAGWKILNCPPDSALVGCPGNSFTPVYQDSLAGHPGSCAAISGDCTTFTGGRRGIWQMFDAPGCADTTTCRLSFEIRCVYRPCHVNPGSSRLRVYLDDQLVRDYRSFEVSCSTWTPLSIPLTPGHHSVAFFGQGDPAWTELIDNVSLSGITPVHPTTWGLIKSLYH